MELDEEKDVGPGNTQGSKDYLFVKEIKKNIKAARDHVKSWRDSARESYDYFAGHQWSPEDKAKLEEQLRPAVVFNRIPRVINAIAGLELQNRQQVVYSPRTNEDVAYSDLLTNAADWVRDQCDAEDEESQMFKDALMVGMGWTETHLDYEVNEDGAILVERVDPLEMLYDPTARKRNLDDVRWVARVKYYNRKDFQQIWPEADEALEDAGDFETDPKGLVPHNATLAPFYKIDQASDDERENKYEIEVVQYQYWKREVYYRVQEPSGEVTVLDRQKYNELKDYFEVQPGFKVLKQTKKVYKQVFLAGDYVLEHGDCPVNAFTFRCVTGMTDNNKSLWFGLIHLMKDPQMWANKWLSQILYIINSNAKGGYWVEKGALDNPREAERTVSSTTFTMLTEDGLQRIKEKTPVNLPPGIEKLMDYAINSISDLVGVNLEMLGMANRDQSGVLEMQRKKAGITVVADFFDALRRYRKEQGRVLADFITSYISDGRLIKINGPGSQQYFPLNKEMMNFEYDIIVDDAPNSPNQREAVFDRLVTLLPFLQSSGIPVPPEILDYSPLPAQLIAAWKKTLEQSSEPSEQEMAEEKIRMNLAETEVVKKQAEAAKDKTSAALNIAKAQKEQSDAMLEAEKQFLDTKKQIEDEKRKDLEAISQVASNFMTGME